MRGFFGFAVVFAMLLLLLGLAVNENRFYSGLGAAKVLMADAEQASKERTIMENNVDRIILFKLGEQASQENFEVELVRGEINAGLIKYLKGRARASTIFSGDLGELTIDFLNENSEALVVEREGITYAEYSFTGGLFNSNTVSSVFGAEARARFIVPPKYFVWVVG
jgi:hypothetical protein